MTDVCFGQSRQEGYLFNAKFKAILRKNQVCFCRRT